MLSVAITEDDIYTRLDLIRKIENYFYAEGIDFTLHEFSCSEDLLSNGSSFDLLFMDIEMKGMNGLEAAKAAHDRNPDAFVIFITSHPDYVFDSFNVNVAAYLLKPVDDVKLAAAIAKVADRVKQKEAPFLLIKQGSVYHKLKQADIVYCESVGHKIRVISQHGTLEYYGNMDALGLELNGFFRCHRAFLVNLLHVRRRGREDIEMANGDVIPLARRKQQEFSAALLSYLKKDVL